MNSYKKLLAKVIVIAFLVTALFSQSESAVAGTVASASEACGKRIIVKYDDENSADLVKETTKNKLKLSKLNTKKRFKKGNLELLEIGSESDVKAVLDELNSSSLVEYAQEDYQVELGSTRICQVK